jgi:1-deoxy-D-xylulose-5-phosphate synthase
MMVMAPADENECRQMLYTGFLQDGPAAVRYPRGRGPGVEVRNIMEALPIGRAEWRRRGARVAILSFGALLHEVAPVAEELGASLLNMRFVKPLDLAAVEEAARGHEFLVTLEDNTILGGAGSGVIEALAELDLQRPLLQLGLPDHLLGHGSREDLIREAGLDESALRRRIGEWLEGRGPTTATGRMVS